MKLTRSGMYLLRITAAACHCCKPVTCVPSVLSAAIVYTTALYLTAVHATSAVYVRHRCVHCFGVCYRCVHHYCVCH